MKTRIEFQRNGLTIRGHLWKNKFHSRHVIILSHGFLANENMCHKYARLFSDMGFVAITFDFCGGGLFSKSDGNTEDMTIMSEKEDLMAVINDVKDRFMPESISLLGCSQGGLVSAMAAKECGSMIKCLVLLYPALCIPDDARKGKMMFYHFDPHNIPDILGRFPIRLGGNYARTVLHEDAFELIKGYDGPVLYLHGTNDKIVDIRYARKAQHLYANCEYHEIEGGEHMFKGKHDRLACAILSKYMKNILYTGGKNAENN
ncbi:MAG: alpha/beta fold hydrolase [Solobacterium sp.]|nr:alpha/beta fold hydrolase [Solobacterium sp.]